MTKFFLLMILFASCVHAQFPYHSNTGTFNAATNAAGTYDAFSWAWNGYDDQVISTTFLPAGFSNVYMRMSYPRRGTVFLDLQTGITTTNSYYAFVSKSNIPPAGVYWTEFVGFVNEATNIPTRVLATGKITVQHSTFQNTNQATWVNPLAGTVIGPPFHALSDLSLWPFTTSTNSGITSSQALSLIQSNAYPLVGNPSNFVTESQLQGATQNITLAESDPIYIAQSNRYAPRSWVAGFSNSPATYNSDFKTIDVTLPDGVTGQLFQENHVLVINNTGSTISNGSVVQLKQASGFNTAIKLASNTNGFDDCFSTLGFATHNIAHGDTGKITTFGNVNELNTIGFSEGTNIWLGVTPGTYQAYMPTNAGQCRVALGMVTREHANQGRVYVRVQFLPDVDDIGAVASTSLGSLAYSNSLTAADVGAVATNDATYTNAVAKAGTAWQNPASATNWGWTSDGAQITLTNYTGPNDVVIPDMLDGLPVTDFAGGLFQYSGIKSVSGGMNIQRVSGLAFQASSITNVSLQNAVSIEGHAFEDCYGLQGAYFPHVIRIEASAFQACSGLANVYLPRAEYIGSAAFFNALSANASLPSAWYIGAQAFNQSDVTSLSIPSATYIGDLAFMECGNLTNIYVSKDAIPETTEYVIGLDINAAVALTVDSPTATGWGATWNGIPVVRLPLYGSGASLTSLDLNPSLTDTVAKAVSAVSTNDARYLASLTNTVAVTNDLGYIVVSNGVTYFGTGIVAGVSGAITNGQSGVVLGSTLHCQPVTITGSTDAVQLSIKANATQNSNVFQVLASDGSTVKLASTKKGELFLKSDGTDNMVFVPGLTQARGVHSGSGNIMTGSRAGENLTSGSYNTIYGSSAGLYYTGSGNTLLGAYSLMGGGTANYNVSVGYAALAYNGNLSTMDYNVSLGYYTMFSATSAKHNVAIGNSSGYSLTSGQSNVFIGGFAGYNQTTGSGLLIINNQNRGTIAGESTNSLIYGKFAATRDAQSLAINANVTVSGNLYLGTTNAFLFTDGTNLFFRNINKTTNAITAN